MKKILLILYSTFFFNVNAFSQDQHLIDSLQTQLKQCEGERTELRKGAMSMRDTISAKILYKISVAWFDADPDKSMDYATQYLNLSEQIGYKKGIRLANHMKGLIYLAKSDYGSALESLEKALKIGREIGFKKGLASSYASIANVYQALSNYSEAIKNHLISLKISEEIGDKIGIAHSYNDIGNIYEAQGECTSALKNFRASLKIKEDVGDKKGIAGSTNNIGNVYVSLGNNAEALKMYNAALKINKEMGNKSWEAINLQNIGSIYLNQKNYDSALSYFSLSLKINNEIGNKAGSALSLGYIGDVYFELKNNGEAYSHYTKAQAISEEIGSLSLIKNGYISLAKVDSAQGNYKQALANYKLYLIFRDSIFNRENTKKQTQTEMQYEFDKKEAASKAEQEKKDALAIEEIQNQKLVRNGFIGGFATVLLFAGTFFIQRNKIKKGKKRSDELLLNILPEEVAEELKETGTSKAKSFKMVSVMFTDFKDFTKITEQVSAEMLVNELHTCFSAFDNILHKHNIEKIKTIGDAYMCVSGLPVANQSHATDMINAALEILDYITARKKEKDTKGEFSFELRIGINSGPVIAGIVGLKKFSYDIWGDTVNTAARIENQGEAGKINISGTTYELVKDKFTCVHRGKITAKNKGEIDMYFINPSPSEG